MITHNLRWLTFLGLLGVLGWILKQPLYFALFGFVAFVPLFWYDERTESIFRRAAAVAFVGGVGVFAATFAYMGVILGPGSRNIDGWDAIGLLGRAFVMWGLTNVLLLVVFAVSYIYLERKGT